MKQFNNEIYVQLKEQTPDIAGYFCKGYERINGKIYLISGNLNIKHSIDDIYTYHANLVLNEISKLEEES